VNRSTPNAAPGGRRTAPPRHRRADPPAVPGRLHESQDRSVPPVRRGHRPAGIGAAVRRNGHPCRPRRNHHHGPAQAGGRPGSTTAGPDRHASLRATRGLGPVQMRLPL